MRLERAYPSDPRSNGFLRGVGRTLVVLEQYHDFYCEGHRVLALEGIESVRADAHERHFERILRVERLRPRRRSVPARALEGWPGLLAWLRRRGDNVIIQCEEPDASNAAFYIGRVERVDDHEVLFNGFDPIGRWATGPDHIAVREITSVEFGTPYIELMSRHLEG
ncbi:MAG: hypothetical protein KIT58_12910 [Planctomycetota bacterium]|nr:hypothetical protein [Planctomycetota bacterium]